MTGKRNNFLVNNVTVDIITLSVANFKRTFIAVFRE